jgi:outer membrane protein assembly factor BamB
MFIRSISILLAGLLIIPSVRADAWPQFRGPDSSGVSKEKGLPVKWGDKEGIRWKVDLPGRGLSNPVIAAGRVYVTASSGYQEQRLHVLCLDEGTGKLLWERQFAATGNTACNKKTCMAAPTPVTDGKRVFALWATGDLAALDSDGNLLWYRSLATDYPDITNQVGMASSPVLADDVLLTPMDNAGDSFLAGIDATSGKDLWRVTRPRIINWVSPRVLRTDGQTQVAYHTAKAVTAYDVKTGREAWNYPADGASTIPSSAVGDGMLFVPGSRFIALKPGKRGQTPEVVWSSNRLPLGYGSPVYFDGRLYGIVRNVGVNCLDARTGERIWQQRVQGEYAASPVIGDGKLYAVNEAGQTTVIELGEEPRILALNKLNDTILATPAIANGYIYLRSDKALYCIGEKK